MRIGVSLVVVFLAGLVTFGSGRAVAAGPNITVLKPADGATVHGKTLTVSVNVTGFRLVAPVFKHPPVLTGFAGSLQYILDGTENYQPRRDLSASTTHTWTNVAPGHHTIIVRLATSQHLPWPNGPVQTVSVTVAPASAPARGHGGSGGTGVNAAPSTGGAADITHSSLTLTWVFAGLLILIGLVLLTSRMVLVPAFGRRQARASRPIPPDPPVQALSVLPGEGDRPAETFDEPTIPSGGVFPADDPIPESALPAEPANPAAAAFPPAVTSTEPAAAPFHFDPEPAQEPAPARPPGEQIPRDRAIEMARQWSGVVENLVRQLDEREAERRRMLDHIRMLEDRVRQSQATREHLREAGGGMSADDLHSLTYLTDALKRDPDHIVNLAAIAQNAGKFHELLNAYTRLREAISEP